MVKHLLNRWFSYSHSYGEAHFEPCVLLLQLYGEAVLENFVLLFTPLR